MLNDSVRSLARKFIKGRISQDNWRVYTAIKIMDLTVEKDAKDIALLLAEPEGGDGS